MLSREKQELHLGGEHQELRGDPEHRERGRKLTSPFEVGQEKSK